MQDHSFSFLFEVVDPWQDFLCLIFLLLQPCLNSSPEENIIIDGNLQAETQLLSLHYMQQSLSDMDNKGEVGGGPMWGYHISKNVKQDTTWKLLIGEANENYDKVKTIVYVKWTNFNYLWFEFLNQDYILCRLIFTTKNVISLTYSGANKMPSISFWTDDLLMKIVNLK